MRVEQYVMAYGIEQDRIRAILPDGFSSIRPVVRINAEIRDDKYGYLEFNTAVEKEGKRGWINIGYWENIPYKKEGKTTTFENDSIKITFTGVGIEGGCPAEKDNVGCYYKSKEMYKLLTAEQIQEKKEFCDCEFEWKLGEGSAHGVSIGKTLPAVPSVVKKIYPREEFTVENAAKIACEQVLGTYKVIFDRAQDE